MRSALRSPGAETKRSCSVEPSAVCCSSLWAHLYALLTCFTNKERPITRKCVNQTTTVCGGSLLVICVDALPPHSHDTTRLLFVTLAAYAMHQWQRVGVSVACSVACTCHGALCRRIESFEALYPRRVALHVVRRHWLLVLIGAKIKRMVLPWYYVDHVQPWCWVCNFAL